MHHNKTLTEHVLQCASPHQAQDVIDRLFGKSLILRAEVLPMGRGASQVMVIMENLEDDLTSIADELKAFFGHESYNLQPLPR